MIYCFLADGFEEVEAIAPVDMLRRAGIEVQTVGVTGKTVTGSHGISVESDLNENEVLLNEALEAIILPGGMPGTVNLEKSEAVQKAIDFAVTNGKYLCAICAAPSILGHKGILKGKNATAFPGFEKELEGAVLSEKSVVCDGKLITAKGAGVAVDFGLEIVSELKGREVADNLKATIQAK